MSDREYVNRTTERDTILDAIARRRDEIANSRIALGVKHQPPDEERAFTLTRLVGLIDEAVRDGRYVDDFELLDVAAVSLAWLEDRAQERAA